MSQEDEFIAKQKKALKMIRKVASPRKKLVRAAAVEKHAGAIIENITETRVMLTSRDHVLLQVATRRTKTSIIRCFRRRNVK